MAKSKFLFRSSYDSHFEELELSTLELDSLTLTSAPTSASHATTKAYVDNLGSSLLSSVQATGVVVADLNTKLVSDSDASSYHHHDRHEFDVVAGESIQSGQVISIAPGGAIVASHSSGLLTKQRLLGIAVTSASSGGLVRAARGVYRNFSPSGSLDTGSAYYLSETGTPVLKSALPTGSFIRLIQVGFALSTKDLDIQLFDLGVVKL